MGSHECECEWRFRRKRLSVFRFRFSVRMRVNVSAAPGESDDIGDGGVSPSPWLPSPVFCILYSVSYLPDSRFELRDSHPSPYRSDDDFRSVVGPAKAGSAITALLISEDRSN